MKKANIQRELHTIAEEEYRDHPIDLWPDLKRSLMNSRNRSTGEIKMKKYLFRKRTARWPLVAGIVMLGLFVFLFATPQGRVLAQDIVKFFQRADSNEQPLVTLAATLQSEHDLPVATALPAGTTQELVQEGCGSIVFPRCSLEEVQKQVSFELQAFQEAPQGLAFTGATLYTGGVFLQYQGENGGLFLIEQRIDEADLKTWQIGKDATVSAMTVNRQPADYVVGSWWGMGITDGEIPWDESIPTRSLIWQSGDIRYILIHFPAQGVNGPVGLNQQQLGQLAETLGDAANAQQAAVADNTMDLKEAEEKAGFSFIMPAWLPDGVALQQTTYNSQHGTICQRYASPSDTPFMPTLVIAESSWALPTIEEIQTKAYYGDQQITIAIEEGIWPVRAANGDAGSFYETGLQIDAVCGGEPTSAHRVLLWQQGERTFALFAKMDTLSGGTFVTREELLRIAEQLNGVSAINQTSNPDKERLTSWEEAQRVADFTLQQPAEMLSDVHFTHITIAESMGYASRSVAYYSGEPTGDGRTYHVMIIQTLDSTATLEELKLAGGYHDVTVKGQPAIYQAQCSDTPPYGTQCVQFLTWFEGDTQFDIETYFPALVPEETVLAIAESMQ